MTKEIPNLAGVITKADVFRKGGGGYAADYVSWARVAHYLNTKAPGWTFHLRLTPDCQHVWEAPNGTGYVVCYFTDPDGNAQADFPYPCMDNRNQPIAIDNCSARVLSDTHRRALCAAAAFQFSLGYELWAKAEIDDAEAEPAPSKAAPTPNGLKDIDIPAEERDGLIERMVKLSPDARNELIQSFRETFGIKDQKIAKHITTGEHSAFLALRLEELGE